MMSDNSVLDFRHDTIISDVSIPSSSTNPNPDEARHLLKCMQPYREKPSQDRSKQFCAGNIYGDQRTHSDYYVYLHQFWFLNPQNLIFSKAKCFIVGQIVGMFHLGTLCDSEKNVIKI